MAIDVAKFASQRKVFSRPDLFSGMANITTRFDDHFPSILFKVHSHSA